jgi:hypothetical protein
MVPTREGRLHSVTHIHISGDRVSEVSERKKADKMSMCGKGEVIKGQERIKSSHSLSFCTVISVPTRPVTPSTDALSPPISPAPQPIGQ